MTPHDGDDDNIVRNHIKRSFEHEYKYLSRSGSVLDNPRENVIFLRVNLTACVEYDAVTYY